jgi:RNA polymerase sigma-70 factor (ECF subfamily)
VTGARETGGPDDHVRAAVASAYRDEWAFVLAATARYTRDLDLAEECTAEAFTLALATWGRDGVPRSPGAWLTTAARRRAIDQIRREKTLRDKLPLLVDPATRTSYGAQSPLGDGWDEDQGTEEADVITDDRLRLVFTCCHPALAREAQVALTLRLLCGLSTADIASAFLVPEPTMAARVTRAKKKIAGARIPYRVPGEAELPDRLDAVLTVVHLLFTTGHTAPAGGDLRRGDLVARAVALGRMLVALMPDEREALGLLALMLLTDARRETRVDEGGRLVLLEDQDRTRWDHDEIGAGHLLVLDALRGGRPGRFALQSAIAALHDQATSWADTDWAQILDLYDLLVGAWPSPVVALNRAVAVAMVRGPASGLAEVVRLEEDGRLAAYHYLPSTKADLLWRLGRYDEAALAFRAAYALAGNEAERVFLAARLDLVNQRRPRPGADTLSP